MPKESVNVKVKGQYYVPGEKGYTIKNYETSLKMPEGYHKGNVKRKLLNTLPTELKDFVALRTFEIVDEEFTEGETSDQDELELEIAKIKRMTRAATEAYIKEQEIDIDPDEYSKVGDLKDAVIKFIKMYESAEDEDEVRVPSARFDPETGEKLDKRGLPPVVEPK